MKSLLNRKLGAASLIVLMNINILEVAYAQSPTNPLIQKYVKSLDGISSNFNSAPKGSTQKKADDFVNSYENFLGRKLSASEKKFMSLEVMGLTSLPRFEIKGNFIQVFQDDKNGKNLLLTIEIVDADKNIFKFGGKTFTLNPEKSIQDNVQAILKELKDNPEVSLLEKVLSPFGLSQAHAMSDLMKYFLIAAVAIVVGLFIGKAWGKNSEKKKQLAREAEAQSAVAEVDAPEEEMDALTESNHTETSVEEVGVPLTPVTTPTTGSDPQMV